MHCIKIYLSVNANVAESDFLVIFFKMAALDHEGLVKEIAWDGMEPELHTFDAAHVPPHLRSPPAPSNCLPLALAVAALTAALVAAVLYLRAQFFYTLPKSIDTPRTAAAPSSEPLLVDFRPLALPTPHAPVASPSSSVTAIEALLRFVDVPYSKSLGLPGPDVGPRAARAGYLRHGPLRLSDPYQALRYLIDAGIVSAEYSAPDDSVDAATALAVQRVCETDLAAAVAYFRWVHPGNYTTNKRVLIKEFAMIWPFGALMLRQARVAMAKHVFETLGRRSAGDVLRLFNEELEALDALISANGGPYLFGERPCAADAAAFGVLDQALGGAALAPQLAEAVATFPAVVSFVQHVRVEYFSEERNAQVCWLGKGSGSKAKAKAA